LEEPGDRSTQDARTISAVVYMKNVSPTAAITLLLCSVVPVAGQQPNPAAEPNAIVIAGDARFTVLTPQLIRMEWSPGAGFENRASLVFLNRRLPVPPFQTRRDGPWQVIDTDALTLRYRAGSGRFGPENLAIELKTLGRTWNPGMPDTANLLGTTRTLDGARGPVQLEPGLISRDGWVVVDDSERPLFDDSPWPWVQTRDTSTHAQDLYFFGYGREFRQALGDFTRVAGKIPMPPRFAFGAWWSRYWAYTDTEFKQLVRDFDRNDVPLDVLVIDMDWHNTFELRWQGQPKDQAGEALGWTGYTWNPTYFPDPEGFLDWVRRQGLRRTLNLHPASGLQPHEAQYPAMAGAMGIDPATKRYVPFEIENKKFATSYFEHVIHPLERQGIDFFWLDWQQWSKTSIAGLTPTWWLNYTFFTDMEREGRARPLIFHRWGGLGNHRYQVGFSGDTWVTWDVLAYEPQFTATAANVGYAYWSHDIGGHVASDSSPELYTRWVQFGIFSPILRTHTSKNASAERRIWAFPVEQTAAMRDAFNLRYQLVPYIYTAARHTYDSGVAMLRPLYYDYPGAREAYDFKGEYLFGDDMIVSPIATPMSPDTLLATTRVWLPRGEWIEWATGARLHGPAIVTRRFSLDQVPVWVRAGAIVPMQPLAPRIGDIAPDTLVLEILPGADDTTRIYDDAGNSLGYQRNEYSWTPVRQHRDAAGALHLEILPAEGSYPGMKRERSYEVRLPFAWPPTLITWQGVPVPWRYNGDRLMAIISLPASDVSVHQELIVHSDPGTPSDRLLDGVPGKLHRLYESMTMLEQLWPTDWPSDALVSLVQTGNRIGLHPDSARVELQRLRNEYPRVLERIPRLVGDTTVIKRALGHLRAR
jgi:alpha-glucosidase